MIVASTASEIAAFLVDQLRGRNGRRETAVETTQAIACAIVDRFPDANDDTTLIGLLTAQEVIGADEAFEAWEGAR